MEQAILQPRPLYGIGTVARLTGIKPDTLRVWERRYGLGASHKSKTGRRQYTQADLEHLQLVSAMVKSGSRIGEIASAERKTLEVMLRNQSKSGDVAVPASKPRVLILGEQLCDWLEEHQGCIAKVDAQLARYSLGNINGTAFADLAAVDMLVVECPTLSTTQLGQLRTLAEQLDATRVLVVYQFANQRWLSELEQQGMSATMFPPDPGYFAFEINRSVTVKASALGDTNLGELIGSKPRQFTEAELSAAGGLRKTLDCECPGHISGLIRALAHFEDYSASCSVENWHDAAVHSSVYTYTGQARWLMERALQSVLEERSDEYRERLKQGLGGSHRPKLAEPPAELDANSG